jgi:hypothetical protein
LQSATCWLEERAREADSTCVAPVVTPELLERIFAFKAGAPDVDNLPYSGILLVPTHSSRGHQRPLPKLVMVVLLFIASFTGGGMLPRPGINSVKSSLGPRRDGSHSHPRYFNDASDCHGRPPSTTASSHGPHRHHQVPQMVSASPTSTTPLHPCDWSGRLGKGDQLSTRRTVHSRPCLLLAATDTETSERVLNAAPNNVLMTRFERTSKRLRDLTPRGMVTPRGDNGTTEVLCLSHVLRGECNSNCRHTAPSLKPKKCLELPNS